MDNRESSRYDNRRSRVRRRRHRRLRGIAMLLPVVLLLSAAAVFAVTRSTARAEEGPALPPDSVEQPAEPAEETPPPPVLPPDTDPQPANPEEEPIEPSLPPQEDPQPGEPVQEPDPVPEEEPSASAGEDGWNLLLVNPWNFIPEDFSVELKSLGGGHSVDKRCYDDLMEMLEACEAEDLSPLVCSSYRTQEKQEYLFDRKIKRLVKQGYSEAEARVEAAKVVAVPGTSEHQLGLALDIVDESYQTLDRAQEETAVQQWLMVHSWEYGFILRYPNEKSEITGIIYEPWHYRYVGREAAAEIYEQGVCLEEYLGAADRPAEE